MLRRTAWLSYALISAFLALLAGVVLAWWTSIVLALVFAAVAVAAWLSNRKALKEAIKVRHVLAMTGFIALVLLPLGLWASMSVLAWTLLIFLGAFGSVAFVVGTSRPFRR